METNAAATARHIPQPFPSPRISRARPNASISQDGGACWLSMALQGASSSSSLPLLPLLAGCRSKWLKKRCRIEAGNMRWATKPEYQRTRWGQKKQMSMGCADVPAGQLGTRAMQHCCRFQLAPLPAMSPFTIRLISCYVLSWLFSLHSLKGLRSPSTSADRPDCGVPLLLGLPGKGAAAGAAAAAAIDAAVATWCLLPALPLFFRGCV